MKIKDVIKKVAVMLQLNNVEEADFEPDVNETTQTEEVETQETETTQETISETTSEETTETETTSEETTETTSEQEQTETSVFDTFDTQTKRDINLIISCINSVVCEIATEHLFLKETESIEVGGGEFELANLSKSFHKLVKVNTTKKYSVKNEKLYIQDGRYDVTYYYIPDEYGFEDEITEFSGRLSIYALCFGVAGEYCLISGNYSESEMWNSRFESAMQSAKRGVKIPNLKERKWL